MRKALRKAASIRKRVTRTAFVEAALGELAAVYLRLVYSTSKEILYHPPDLLKELEDLMPCIITSWHGTHLMMPFLKQKHFQCCVLISRSSSGSMYARVARRLGLDVVRGSTAIRGNWNEKGGHVAFRQLLRALQSGISVGMTPDVVQKPRTVGMGLILLAQQSKCPIVPATAVTSGRRILTKTKDHMMAHYLFSKRLVFAFSDPIYVSSSTEDAELQAKRSEVARALDEIHTAALALADASEAAEK
jgi:lysophospholipid acyltransferase (LPLAT)-like uncharacterized protein